MNENPLILTHCGQLGDFIYSLPIAAWIHKTQGRNIHWVLPRAFGPFRFIESLLRLQEFTEAVTLIDYKVQTYAHGGQPYRFKPEDWLRIEPSSGFVVPGSGLKAGEDYLNLGFRGFPDKFITQYMAEEYGLGWDAEWVLNLGMVGVLDNLEYGGRRCFTEHSNYAHWTPVYPGERMDLRMDILHNAHRMFCSREAHCFYSSMAVIMYFARRKFYLYRQPGHPSEDLYFPDRTRYEIRLCPA